jgi:hypothetical protein
MTHTLYVGEREPPPETLPALGAWRSLFPATDAQVGRLFDIARAKHATHFRVRNLDAFRAALIYVDSRGRLPEPDRRWFVSAFCDDAELFAKAIGAPAGDVPELTFAAAIAIGDCPYSLRSAEFSESVGLTRYPMDRKPTFAWKGILEGTRELRQPTPPPQSVVAQPSTVRVARNFRDAEPWGP